MTIKAKDKYIIVYPKDDDGHEIKRRFVLSIGKNIQRNKDVALKFVQGIYNIDGIDQVNVMGIYTMEIFIGQCFDVDEVTTALKLHLDDILSDIIKPKSNIIT